MSAKLWEAASNNAFQTTLNGAVSAVDESITLTTTSGLVAPGVLCIDRQDGNKNDTPLLKEYISFTGVAGEQITGVVRGLGGTSAQSHLSGALVEEVFSITHWKDLIDFLKVSHDAAGNLVVSSTATLANVKVETLLDISTASVMGRFPIHPTWVVGGACSLATTAVGKPLPMPQEGTIKFFSAALRTPVSAGVTMALDVNKNGVTLFTTQAARLFIGSGGTYASTASMAVNTVAAGDTLSMDIDGGGGTAADLSVVGRIE